MHTVQCIPFDRRRIHFEFFRLTSLIRPAEVYPPDSFGTFMVHQNNSLEWFIGMMRVIHFEWFMCLMKRHAKTILSILILQFEPWELWEPCKRQEQCIVYTVYTAVYHHQNPWRIPIVKSMTRVIDHEFKRITEWPRP